MEIIQSITPLTEIRESPDNIYIPVTLLAV